MNLPADRDETEFAETIGIDTEDMKALRAERMRRSLVHPFATLDALRATGGTGGAGSGAAGGGSGGGGITR